MAFTSQLPADAPSGQQKWHRPRKGGYYGYLVRATVDVSEMMDNEKFLHMVVDGRSSSRESTLVPGPSQSSKIDVMFDLNRARLFDPNTNLAIDKIDIPEGLREEARAHAEAG